MVLISRQSQIRTSSVPTLANCVTAPATPSGLSATNPQGDLLILDWNDLAGVDEYVAYIGDTPNFAVANALAVRTVNFSSASFANLTLGVTYYFKVKAVNTCGESLLSPEISVYLAFQYPTRFNIVSRLQPNLKLCGDSAVLYAYIYCDDINSLMFQQESDNTLRRAASPGLCMTRGGAGLVSYQPCVSSPDQQWSYNAQDNTLCSLSDPNAGCLRLGVPLDPIANGLNWGPKSTDEVSDWLFSAI
jgi:hypothetical protein